MKFLFFKLRQICYNSNGYFIDQLQDGLEALGHQVTVFDSNDQPLTALEQFSGQHFDAVLDFNSNLTRLETDQGIPFLDTIDAPFYHWILDHPLYHHDTLTVPLKNQHVLCLDLNHVEYVKQYYPQVQSVHFLPLWGMWDGTAPVALDNRSIPVLFTGTYTDPEDYQRMIDGFDPAVSAEMKAMIQTLLSDPSLTLEQAFQQYLMDHHLQLEGIHFALRMHLYFLVDSYITAYFRKQAVMQLVSDGIPLTTIGKGWEYFPLKDVPHFHGLGPKTFVETFPYTKKAKMLFNIQPWFKNGVHDRVFTAMLNGAVSVTDSSLYLTNHFHPGSQFLQWSLQNLPGMSLMIRENLSNSSACNSIAETAFKTALGTETREARIQSLLKIIHQEEN